MLYQRAVSETISTVRALCNECSEQQPQKDATRLTTRPSGAAQDPMVAMELFLLIHAHCAQGGADGSASRSEDGACYEHLTCCQTLLENSGAKGAKARIIVAGRVRISIDHLFWEIAVTSVPYLFRP